MRVRSGFVSNSSNSSFIIIYLPDNFDPEVYIDYINEKNKKKTFPKSVVNDLRQLVKKGHVNEQNDCEDYYELYDAVYKLNMFQGETNEECGYIQAVKKKYFEKLNKIDAEYNTDKMKQATLEIREKREKMKLKYKHIDPYGEEDWEVEELKIKTLYDFMNESFEKKSK